MKLSTTFAATLLALAANGADAQTRIGQVCINGQCAGGNSGNTGSNPNGVYTNTLDAFGRGRSTGPNGTVEYQLDPLTGQPRIISPQTNQQWPYNQQSGSLGAIRRGYNSANNNGDSARVQRSLGAINPGYNFPQRGPLGYQMQQPRTARPTAVPPLTSSSLSPREQYIAGYGNQDMEPITLGNQSPKMFTMKSARGEINCHESVLDETIERDLNKLCGVDETPPVPGEKISNIAVWTVIDNPYPYYKAVSKTTEAFCKHANDKPQGNKSVIPAGKPFTCITVTRNAPKRAEPKPRG